jgi:hypothetical protein
VLEVADAVGEEGTAVAALFLVGVEHEVVDDELLVLAKHVKEARFSVWALEDVVLLDSYHWELAALTSGRFW